MIQRTEVDSNRVRALLITLGYTVKGLDEVIQDRLRKFPQEPNWPKYAEVTVVCDGLYHIDNVLRHVRETIFMEE